MNTHRLVSCLLLAAVGTAAWALSQSEEKSHKLTSVSMRKMADSLHAVIAADRQVYSRAVIQRLHTDEKRLLASEDWRAHHGLPVHAQMLRMAATSIQTEGAEFSYTLRSLWPINASHGPQTKVEQEGLETVTHQPESPYYTEETLGGRSYFTAVYADRASLTSCVDCHNQHPGSPRRDFRLHDVMGAIVVRIPLEF
jgi:hypothetical protein